MHFFVVVYFCLGREWNGNHEEMLYNFVKMFSGLYEYDSIEIIRYHQISIRPTRILNLSGGTYGNPTD